MIKYPNGKSHTSGGKGVEIHSHANRGMHLESMINESNRFYIDSDICYIYKKPTPIKVINVRHSNKEFYNSHEITKAYYCEKSTTDYNGIYLGKYIDFEAKETKSMTFNIQTNLKAHQLQHLINCKKHGGITFIIVYFSSIEEVYILSTEKILNHIDSGNNIIKHDYFKREGYPIKIGLNPPLDYIKKIDEFFIKEKYE